MNEIQRLLIVPREIDNETDTSTKTERSKRATALEVMPARACVGRIAELERLLERAQSVSRCCALAAAVATAIAVIALVLP